MHARLVFCLLLALSLSGCNRNPRPTGENRPGSETERTWPDTAPGNRPCPARNNVSIKTSDADHTPFGVQRTYLVRYDTSLIQFELHNFPSDAPLNGHPERLWPGQQVVTVQIWMLDDARVEPGLYLSRPRPGDSHQAVVTVYTGGQNQQGSAIGTTPVVNVELNQASSLMLCGSFDTPAGTTPQPFGLTGDFSVDLRNPRAD